MKQPFGLLLQREDVGAEDDGLLLLVQQPNQLPFGADEAVDLPVRVVEKPHDGGLFVGWRQEDGLSQQFGGSRLVPPSTGL